MMSPPSSHRPTALLRLPLRTGVPWDSLFREYLTGTMSKVLLAGNQFTSHFGRREFEDMPFGGRSDSHHDSGILMLGRLCGVGQPLSQGSKSRKCGGQRANDSREYDAACDWTRCPKRWAVSRAKRRRERTDRLRFSSAINFLEPPAHVGGRSKGSCQRARPVRFSENQRLNDG
jgi:hypothetical protein